MVVFDQLRIDKEGKYLYIDAHLRRDLQNGSATISEVWVCDSSDYTEGGIPNKAQKVYTFNEEENNSRNSVSLVINPIGQFDDNGNIVTTYDNFSSNTFLNKLLFIYVVVTGVDETTLSCGCSKNPTIGVALSMNNVYKEFLSLINDLNCNPCTKPTYLADFILRLNALILSIDAQQYILAIDFFNKWFSNESNTMEILNCRCNG